MSLRFLINDYFEAKTNAEKDKRAKIIREFAKDIKTSWEGKTIEEINNQYISKPEEYWEAKDRLYND